MPSPSYKQQEWTDLEQNGYNHNQEQEASNTAANDDGQRVELLGFQEDDSDLDKETSDKSVTYKGGRESMLF